MAIAGAAKAGGIIYSGTPENVGPVVKGDVLCGSRSCAYMEQHSRRDRCAVDVERPRSSPIEWLRL
jgi:hypothetical protein